MISKEETVAKETFASWNAMQIPKNILVLEESPKSLFFGKKNFWDHKVFPEN